MKARYRVKKSGRVLSPLSRSLPGSICIAHLSRLLESRWMSMLPAHRFIAFETLVRNARRREGCMNSGLLVLPPFACCLAAVRGRSAAAAALHLDQQWHWQRLACLSRVAAELLPLRALSQLPDSPLELQVALLHLLNL